MIAALKTSACYVAGITRTEELGVDGEEFWEAQIFCRHTLPSLQRVTHYLLPNIVSRHNNKLK